MLGELQSPVAAIDSRALRWTSSDRRLLVILVLAFSIAYVPTYVKLIQGPWRTEQEGHGPLIILAALWLVWQCRARLAAATPVPAPISGWAILIAGLGAMVIARSQDVLLVEVASQILVLCGCVLLVAGRRVLRILAFPLAFMIFSVPPPGWMLDAFTVPLKAQVSDWVAQLLYALDYPIAQNGVMIMIGTYQLMVKDACAGMNSIFALSAIGVFYVHAFVHGSRVRTLILLASILPITVAANFARVTALALIAYYGGIDAIEGIYHDLTGFALFAVALCLFLLLDTILIACGALFRRLSAARRSTFSLSPLTGGTHQSPLEHVVERPDAPTAATSIRHERTEYVKYGTR
jgi:exosortase B